MTEALHRPGSILLLGATLLAAGCDLSFRHDDGDTVVQGSFHGEQGSGFGLRAGGAAVLRPEARGGEILLRFTAPPDLRSARGAVRVVDENRGDEPIPVDLEVRGADMVLRASVPEGGEGGFRSGAHLRIEVAGMPSLRALRSERGAVLPRTAVLEMDVRDGLHGDRDGPFLVASDPEDGAEGVDPGATLRLRFSEPLHRRILVHPRSPAGPGEGGAVPLRLLADGRNLRFRTVADRTGAALTLIPEEGLPGGAVVEVRLSGRIRDRSGNPLADESSRRISFTTGPTAGGTGWIVEPFADTSRRDPGGTTVPWGDAAHPGVLVGLATPLVLDTETPGVSRPLLLDPSGSRFRVLVPAALLGEEPRLLRGLRLPAAPGSGGGRILDPVVRITSSAGLLQPEVDGVPPFPWQTVAEDLGSVGARGAEDLFFLPFRTPYRYDGIGDLLVEVGWSGVVGTVVLRGTDTGQPSMLVYRWPSGPVGLAPEPVGFAVSLRFEGTGERAVARSTWFAAAADRPVWQEPFLRPAGDASRVRLRFQGAPDGAEPGETEGRPDPSRATPWTGDVRDLEGLPWIRFRIEFVDPDPFAPVIVDDLSMAYGER